MATDYYEVLQVHPRAEADAITAAYTRLRALYNPAQLEGAAEELINLARQKRDDIERAYAVLSDPVRRASYDTELTATQAPPSSRQNGQSATNQPPSGQAMLDYRPLPPAGRAERSRGFDAQPVKSAAVKEQGRKATPSRPRPWIGPAILAGLLLIVVTAAIAITGGSGTALLIAPPPQVTTSLVDQFEAQLPQLRALAEQNPNDPKVLIQYANQLYDSAEVARQVQPDSQIYQQRLPRWLEASQVYSKALALDPSNAEARADMGVSTCFYGTGTGDQNLVRNGTAEARRAAQAAPDDERVLYNFSRCLLSSQPPQTEEALANLHHIVKIASPDSQYSIQARELISTYETQ